MEQTYGVSMYDYPGVLWLWMESWSIRYVLTVEHAYFGLLDVVLPQIPYRHEQFRFLNAVFGIAMMGVTYRIMMEDWIRERS